MHSWCLLCKTSKEIPVYPLSSSFGSPELQTDDNNDHNNRQMRSITLSLAHVHEVIALIPHQLHLHVQCRDGRYKLSWNRRQKQKASLCSRILNNRSIIPVSLFFSIASAKVQVIVRCISWARGMYGIYCTKAQGCEPMG